MVVWAAETAFATPTLETFGRLRGRVIATPDLFSGLLRQRVAHDLGAQPDAVLAHALDGLGNRDGIALLARLDQHADGTGQGQS